MRKLTALLLAAATSTFAVSASAGPTPTKLWNTGFEWEGKSPPFEFDLMDPNLFVPPTQTTPNAGQTSAWTYVDASQAPGIVTSGHAYKGWDAAVDTSSHRPYPMLDRSMAGGHPFPGPVLVNAWRVYLDQGNAGQAVGTSHWIQFATLGNLSWYENLIRIDVDDGKVVVDGQPFQYIGPSPQPDFPIGKWVTFTVYMDFEDDAQTWHIWQDGVSTFQYTGSNPGTHDLVVAHWGMYSGHNVDSGAQYNDDIALWSLSEPLTSFDSPPPNPYGDDDGGSGGGGSGATGGGASGGGGASSAMSSGAGGRAGSGGGGACVRGCGASSNGGGAGDSGHDAPSMASGCTTSPGAGAPLPLALSLAMGALALVRRRR